MKNIDELLDALKKQTGLSDRKLGPLLGFGEGIVTQWRTRRTLPGDDVARKVSELLKVDPAHVAAILNAERAARDKRTDDAAMWLRVAQRFAALAVVAVGVNVAAPSTSQAGTSATLHNSNYTLRRKPRFAAPLGGAYA